MFWATLYLLAQFFRSLHPVAPGKAVHLLRNRPSENTRTSVGAVKVYKIEWIVGPLDADTGRRSPLSSVTAGLKERSQVKIKHAIKLKTSPARLAQLLQNCCSPH